MHGLVNFKLYYNGKKQVILLEPIMIVSLQEIAKLEKVSVRELCNLIARTDKNNEIASAIRVFVCSYYRNMALILPADYIDDKTVLDIKRNASGLKIAESK